MLRREKLVHPTLCDCHPEYRMALPAMLRQRDIKELCHEQRECIRLILHLRSRATQRAP